MHSQSFYPHVLRSQISANLSHKMLIKMQHAVFDDSSIQYAFWYVCNIHELRWNLFFCAGSAAPRRTTQPVSFSIPEPQISASPNHSSLFQSLPGTRGRRANIRDILSTTSFKPRPPVGLQSLWEQCHYIYILSQCKLVYSVQCMLKSQTKNWLQKYFISIHWCGLSAGKNVFKCITVK